MMAACHIPFAKNMRKLTSGGLKGSVACSERILDNFELIIIIEVGAMRKSLGISRNKYEILQASKSNLARKKNM